MSNSGPGGSWGPTREATHLSREAYMEVREFLARVAREGTVFLRVQAAAALATLDGEVPAHWRDLRAGEPAPVVDLEWRIPTAFDPHPYTDEELEP